jgi:NAD(P)-dependent dehydrogenase (short-subunit alcohol dehydrogenase family)
MRVRPSLTRTLATAKVLDEAKQLVAQQRAIKRLAEPEDIVGRFLASEKAAFFTGQALVVDGRLYKIG